MKKNEIIESVLKRIAILNKDRVKLEQSDDIKRYGKIRDLIQIITVNETILRNLGHEGKSNSDILH